MYLNNSTSLSLFQYRKYNSLIKEDNLSFLDWAVKDLTPSYRRIFEYLWSYCRKYKKVNMSYATIAGTLGISEVTVKRALKQLVELKFIFKKRQHNYRRSIYKSNHYKINSIFLERKVIEHLAYMFPTFYYEAQKLVKQARQFASNLLSSLTNLFLSENDPRINNSFIERDLKNIKKFTKVNQSDKKESKKMYSNEKSEKEIEMARIQSAQRSQRAQEATNRFIKEQELRRQALAKETAQEKYQASLKAQVYSSQVSRFGEFYKILQSSSQETFEDI